MAISSSSSSSQSFSEQDFYGGGIIGVIPRDWIDASAIREVPDHQEIFLSPTTLTNMIVEINQRVSRSDALDALRQEQTRTQRERFSDSNSVLTGMATTAGGTPAASAETIDKGAILYHLNDLLDEGDSMDIIVQPRRVNLSKFLSSSVSAYTGVVCYNTPKRRRHGGPSAPPPSTITGASQPRNPVLVDEYEDEDAAGSVDGSGLQPSSKSTCHYLLVRLEEQETDLLVFVNVPHDEFDVQGDHEGLSREEELASQLIEKMVEALEVRDWSLFG